MAMRFNVLDNIPNKKVKRFASPHKKMMIFLSLLIAAGYAIFLASDFIVKEADYLYLKNIAKSSSQIVVSENNSAKPFSVPTLKFHSVVNTQNNFSSVPQSVNREQNLGTSTALKIQTTSSALVKSMGGGYFTGSSNNISSQSSEGTSNAGVLAMTTSAMRFSSSARLASRGLTAANTLASEQNVMESTNSARSSIAPRRVGADDVPEEPFPDPVSVGDMFLPLLLLAAGYALFSFCRRKELD